MKKKALLLWLMVSSAVLLGGCVKSAGILETTVPLSVKMTDYKTMMISVSSTEADAAEEIAQLESMTIEKLKEKNLFATIIPGSSSPPQKTGLNLVLTISSLKKVSGFQRKMYGPAAGRAFIIVEGEMVDVKTKQTVGAFRVQGESSGGSALAGTTPQAIERAVEQIVIFVQGSV